jgi:putative glutamine amidotransferase
MGAHVKGERPLVAVTTSELRVAGDVHRQPQGEPARKEMALGLAYVSAVEEAGALPVVVTPLHADAIEPLLDRVNGLCISGGPDLDPSVYGEEPHEKLGPIEPEIDLFELTLVKAAVRRRMPVLAICRGAQVLNVARGGTLAQHLPDLSRKIRHRQKKPGSTVTHPVRLDPKSKTARIMGVEEAEVNSFHHQAVSTLGRGLRAVGWAPDDTVEAIEDPRRDFLIGVQWHLESLTALPEHAALFTAFNAASRLYAEGQAEKVRAA